MTHTYVLLFKIKYMIVPITTTAVIHIPFVHHLPNLNCDQQSIKYKLYANVKSKTTKIPISKENIKHIGTIRFLILNFAI